MSSVDSRIVTMKFDNVAFERGVSTTMTSLSKLKGSLDLSSASSKATGGLGNVQSALGKFTSNPFHAVATGLGNLTTGFGIFSKLNPFSHAVEGAGDLQRASSNVSFGAIQGGITSVSNGFIAMATVGITAISNIVTAIGGMGINLAKSFTIDPIKSGLSEYETNLNSIQTILANTSADHTNLKDVNGALSELNTYSDKTIYNFSQMARNIGTFTAAGIDLDSSVSAIKGIANLAAVSGSNSDQASTAMYQLSQAMAAGKVTLMDWNSVVNAGMGGKVFQTALMDTARAQGVDIDGIVKEAGSFRASLEQGWITTDVMTNTLNKFTGDMTKKQLIKKGYDPKQVKTILAMGKTATDAATKVKTVTALLDTLKETAGSGWTQSWALVLGNFNEARDLFTNVNNVLGGMLGASAKARNKILGDWKKLGGRTVLIDAIKNAWTALMHILKPIHDAFRDIFPRKTGKDLYDLTVGFRNFTKGLIANKALMSTIKTVFTTLFNVIGLGIDVVKALFQYMVVDLFKLLKNGSGGVMVFVKSIFSLINAIVSWVREGDKIGAFFDKLGQAREKLLGPIIKLIGVALTYVGHFIGTLANGVGGALDTIAGIIMPLISLIGKGLTFVKTLVIDVLINAFNSAKPTLIAIGAVIAGIFVSLGTIGDKIGGALSHLDSMFSFGDTAKGASKGIDGVTKALSFAAPAASGAMSIFQDFMSFLGDFATTIVNVAQDIGTGIAAAWNGTGDAFGAFGGDVGGIWAKIKAMFGTIADKFIGYIGNMDFNDALALVNTGFFIALYAMIRSFAGKFGKMVGAITETFDSFTGVMKQVTSNLKTMQTDVRANIILKIAIALGLLTVAVYVLSKIDAKGLAIGLGGIAALLTMLVVALTKLEKSSKSMSGAAQLSLIGLAMIGLGIGLVALSVALTIMGKLDPKELTQGLIAVGLVLGGIVAMTTVLSKTGGAGQLLVAAGAIIILGVALTIFAGAIKLFSGIDASTLLNGGLKIVAVLAALGLVMSLMPPTMLSSAAALIIIATALVLMAGAMKIFGNFSVEEMAKSLIMLGGALAIIAIGMTAMTTALPGAAALLVVSAALRVLLPVLEGLGKMSIGDILKSLGALAAIFLVIGVAALVLTPVVPVILLLGQAMLWVGGGMALAGLGLVLFAAGLTALAVSGAAGFAVLSGIIIGLAEMIPLVVQQIGLGIQAALKVIIDLAPKMGEAAAALLKAFFTAITNSLPALATLILQLLTQILRILEQGIPQIIETGWHILKALLTGIRNHMPAIVVLVGQIIISLINALTKAIPRIVAAGFRLLVAFLKGIGNGITKVVSTVMDIIRKFLDAINARLPGIITAGFKLLLSLLRGISQNIGKVVDAVTDIIVHFLDALGRNLPRIIDAGMRLLINLLNGIAKAIRENSSDIEAAGWNVATAIVQGVLNGFASFGHQIVDSLLNIAKAAFDGVKHFFGIGSPSKEMAWVGQMLLVGFSGGIKKHAHLGVTEAERMGKGVLDTMKKTMSGVSDLGGLDAQPRITPVLDITKFQRDAQKMGSTMNNMKPIHAELSAKRAAYLAASHESNRESEVKHRESHAPREVKFEQHNHSPKALSHVEIYRQTRNQLSLAKEELMVT